MKKTEGNYYLGRIPSLRGRPSDDKYSLLSSAIRDPVSVMKRNFAYIFTEFRPIKALQSPDPIFGHLVKYRPEGEVDVLEKGRREEATIPMDDLVEASSPFVYLPEFSGLAYLHISNKLETLQFEEQFSAIVKHSHRDFFIDCEVRPIVELTTFTHLLSRLEQIKLIDAKVMLPNPSFSRCWKSLRDYIKRRNIEIAIFKEQSARQNGLKSALPGIARDMLKHAKESDGRLSFPKEGMDIDAPDAAVLMAADGYGKAKIKGSEDGGKEIEISTIKTRKSFVHSRSPKAEELYEHAREEFSKLREERGMTHDD